MAVSTILEADEDVIGARNQSLRTRDPEAENAGSRATAEVSSPALVLLPQGSKEGVHNVHTLGFGSGRTGAGLARIAEDFGGVAGSQGLEPGSSPTSGTVFPQVRGIFGVFSCAHCAHSGL